MQLLLVKLVTFVVIGVGEADNELLPTVSVIEQTQLFWL